MPPGASCVDGLKSLKIVNAAVRPGPLTGSRLSPGSGWPSGAGSTFPGASPPPATVKDVFEKLVSVARAARETIETHVDPATLHSCAVTSPWPGSASAELMWQPKQKGWFAIGPAPSLAGCAEVKRLIPSSICCRSAGVVAG